MAETVVKGAAPEIPKASKVIITDTARPQQTPRRLPASAPVKVCLFKVTACGWLHLATMPKRPGMPRAHCRLFPSARMMRAICGTAEGCIHAPTCRRHRTDGHNMWAKRSRRQDAFQGKGVPLYQVQTGDSHMRSRGDDVYNHTRHSGASHPP